MKPPIITLSPVCTKARVLMLPSRDAGVADGVGVDAPARRTPCARNSPAATTVNAKAKQKLIRVLPKTPAHQGQWIKNSLVLQAQILWMS